MHDRVASSASGEASVPVQRIEFAMEDVIADDVRGVMPQAAGEEGLAGLAAAAPRDGPGRAAASTPSIIPPPGSPGVAPNLTTAFVLENDIVIGAGSTYFSTSLTLVFQNYGLQTGYAGLNNAGRVWGQGADSVALIDAYNCGAIVNSGLLVAEALNGHATTILVGSYFQGLTNSGDIYAIALNGTARAFADWYGATLANSGVIAAQGRYATAVSRANGGQIVNSASGQILAEGQNAVAVYLGRGFLGEPGDNIVNAGEIRAHSIGTNASVAIYLEHLASERMAITNTGVIAGDIAIYVDDYAFSPVQHGREVVKNEAGGVIEGVIYLARGDDEIVNKGAITGDVFLGEGDDLFDSSLGLFQGVADMGWGDDRFLGGADANIAMGDRGNDELQGGGGADLLIGGRGDDLLIGGSGNDGLYGDYGDDQIITQGGDRVVGGGGDDLVILGDYSFASVDGGQGWDVLRLANTSRTLDLSAALASGRMTGFEEIELPGNQRLVIRAADLGAMSLSGPLRVDTTALGRVDLVGSWTAAGSVSIEGVIYQRYTSGGAEVLVAGGGTVAVAPAPPGGAAGLDAVAGGAVAPVPGSPQGVELATSLTEVSHFDLTSSLTIDTDETWIEYGSYAVIGGQDPFVELVNNGLIRAIGNGDGARGLGFSNVGRITNFGTILSEAHDDGSKLSQNLAVFATYGLSAAGGMIATAYGLIVSSTGAGILNAGQLLATSESGSAIGYANWMMQDARNEGLIRAVSQNLVGVGVIANNGGSLVNTGTIEAQGAVGAVGIMSRTHAATFVNTGIITATDGPGGDKAVGVLFYYQGGESRLTNSGTITADYAVRSAMMVNGGGVYIANSGEMHGKIALNLAGDGASSTIGRQDVIVNTGLIDGEVRLGGERDIYIGAGGRQIGAVYGEDGADILVGGLSNDDLRGDAGDDILAGDAGADRLTGGSGRDIFIYRAAAHSTGANFDTITDFVTGEDRIDLTALAPTSVTLITVADGTQVVAQSSGGTLTLLVKGTITLSDIVTAQVPTITGPSTAAVLVATSGGSSLHGGDGDDTLFGSSAADRLDGGAGVNLLVGGAGDDLYVIARFAEGVIRELPGGGVDTIEVQTSYGWFVLPDEVENLVLVSGTDGTGNALANIITGNAGANTLDGAAGADRLVGGGGNDKYWVDNLGDVVVELGGEGMDGVISTVSFTLSDNVENLTLAELSGDLSGTGNGLANLLIGNYGANELRGGGGDDQIIAGWGADRIWGDDGNDLIYAEVGADTVWGGAGDDEIWGENGADLLLGGEGADRLSGSSKLVFDGIGWRLREGGADGDDVLDGGAGDDWLEGADGSDILIGGTGNDVLIGATAAINVAPYHGDDPSPELGSDAWAPDYLFGGTGNDTYYVYSAMTGAQDLVDEGEGNAALSGGAGDVDTIISQGALFWDFYSVGEVLQIDRDAGGQIVGGRNVLNKTITGDIGNDVILTYGRSSTVDAGAGTDAISFELYGLGESYEGSNTLVMKPGNGMDYLYGFESGEDQIDLSGFGYGLTGAQWQSFLVDVENGDNDYCFLYLGQPGQYLVFVGVTSSQITAGDFIG